MAKQVYIKFEMTVPGDVPVENQIKVAEDHFMRSITKYKTALGAAKWTVKRYYSGEIITVLSVLVDGSDEPLYEA